MRHKTCKNHFHSNRLCNSFATIYCLAYERLFVIYVCGAHMRHSPEFTGAHSSNLLFFYLFYFILCCAPGKLLFFCLCDERLSWRRHKKSKSKQAGRQTQLMVGSSRERKIQNQTLNRWQFCVKTWLAFIYFFTPKNYRTRAHIYFPLKIAIPEQSLKLIFARQFSTIWRPFIWICVCPWFRFN